MTEMANTSGRDYVKRYDIRTRERLKIARDLARGKRDLLLTCLYDSHDQGFRILILYLQITCMLDKMHGIRAFCLSLNRARRDSCVTPCKRFYCLTGFTCCICPQ